MSGLGTTRTQDLLNGLAVFAYICALYAGAVWLA